MSNLGMGVMLNMLSSNAESVEAFKKAVDGVIKSIIVSDNTCKIEFENGYKLGISDEGQSCCEYRYMVCDDDLSYFEGAKLLDAEVKNVSTQNDEDDYGDCHEIQFLEIMTNKGSFTIANHNEHNGYYGGFWVVCRELSL